MNTLKATVWREEEARRQAVNARKGKRPARKPKTTK